MKPSSRQFKALTGQSYRLTGLGLFGAVAMLLFSTAAQAQTAPLPTCGGIKQETVACSASTGSNPTPPHNVVIFDCSGPAQTQTNCVAVGEVACGDQVVPTYGTNGPCSPKSCPAADLGVPEVDKLKREHSRLSSGAKLAQVQPNASPKGGAQSARPKAQAPAVIAASQPASVSKPGEIALNVQTVQSTQVASANRMEEK